MDLRINFFHSVVALVEQVAKGHDRKRTFLSSLLLFFLLLVSVSEIKKYVMKTLVERKNVGGRAYNNHFFAFDSPLMPILFT